ncbi:MAG TPA: NAD-dependent epimerase/dehydratase family protein, partial [Solirubrobacteraceae bacterium]|nr:NAD-dependent epimerase/dehydratase family protein [Solirubrobacteraceae bacterium]
MRASVSGATGLIGRRLVRALLSEGAEVTVLSRDPVRARERLRGLPAPVEAVAWDPLAQPAPTAALEGRDAVVHLAGASIAQRWSERARSAIRESRVRGTEHLVAGLAAASERPRTLICSSAAGYYGRSGEEPLDEDSPPGADFLAQ